MAAENPQRVAKGTRFSPTDEELIEHYLRRKIDGSIGSVSTDAIPEFDILKHEPWNFYDLLPSGSQDRVWHFFTPRDRKYAKGKKSNRSTVAGFWKPTGKDRSIKGGDSGEEVIGWKKTLVFHLGRAPNGTRKDWIMHEYRTAQQSDPAEESSGGADQGGEFYLCKLFDKNKVQRSTTSNSSTEPARNNVGTLTVSPPLPPHDKGKQQASDLPGPSSFRNVVFNFREGEQGSLVGENVVHKLLEDIGINADVFHAWSPSAGDDLELGTNDAQEWTEIMNNPRGFDPDSSNAMDPGTSNSRIRLQRSIDSSASSDDADEPCDAGAEDAPHEEAELEAASSGILSVLTSRIRATWRRVFLLFFLVMVAGIFCFLFLRSYFFS